MKKFYIILLIVLISQVYVFSQCFNCTTHYPLTTQSIDPCETKIVGTLPINGGYYTSYNVTQGITYTWSTCGSNPLINTQLTLFQGASCGSGQIIAYNDDYCGTLSSINWTATFTGKVTLLVSKYNCVDSSGFLNLPVTLRWTAKDNSGCPGDFCITKKPFCTDTLYSFPAGVNSGVGEAGPSYCCLQTTPNPVWYYLYIDQPGNIEIHIHSDVGQDLDFICWGPFNDINTPCQNSDFYLTNSGTSCSNHHSPGPSSDYPGGYTVDCSYDPASEEWCYIPNTQVGQYYILLITNYSNQPTNIIFEQTNAGQTGAGHTDCNVVFCNISSLTANPTTCNTANNTYSVSGTISFINPPTSGQLIISDNSGVSQTFNAPFNSPITYNLNGLISDGTTHTISAYFTNAPSCIRTVQYTSPQLCSGCLANAGNDKTVCGLTTNLSAQIMSGNTSYQWSSTPGINFANIYSPTTSVTASSPGVYSLTWNVTSTTGVTCSDQVLITFVHPNLSVSADPSNICAGSNSILSASGCNSYYWSNGLSSGSTKTVTPSTTTTYSVTGSANGCTNTATVTVNVISAPTITVSALPTSVCPGASSVLTASGASDYGWSHGLGNGASKTVTPTSNTTYTVTGTNGTCSATAAVTVTVNPAPTLTVNATDNQLCTGESATITANGANTYNWSHSLGSGTSKTVSPTSTTTYTVTGISAEGCSNTASISITVNPVPNVSANASPNTICIGGSSTLSASGVNTYSWSNGSSGASITVSPSSTTTYTVTGTSTAGCTNTATVTVNISTTINITANANPSSICEDASSILSASGADTYNWSNSMNLATITVTPTNTTSYTVTGYSGGCTGTATVSVTVHPLPTVIASANPSSICYNEVTTLTASGANNYSWSHSLGTGSNVTVAPTTNTTYTVTGTNIYNCSNTASVSIVVNPIPTVNITASSTTLCQGDETILTATGAESYSWSHGLGTNNIITVSPSSTTTYTVVGTNTAGCSATASIAITVNPNADATINPIDPLCDNQGQITLTAHTSGGLWSGTGITNQVLGTFSPAIAGTGTHAITYMISGMCGDTATTEISIYDSPDATAYATDETCIDANDGIAWVEVTGGTPPYAFLWSTYHTLDSIANLAPGEYYVTANDFHNCSDKDTVLIKPGTEDCYITHIYVPNIFSPDDKGNPENEYLRVYGKGIKSIDFKIFDRWGNEVFHTTDINLGWDGTYKGEPALTGDYTYILKVSYTKKPDDIIKGHIYLIR